MNIKPIYTKEMVDAGVIPSVGMDCQTSTGIVTVRYVGKSVVVAEDDENYEFTMSKKGALHSLKPLTPPIELIDGKAYQFEYEDCETLALSTCVGVYDSSKVACMWVKGNAYTLVKCTNIQLLEVKNND